MKLVSEKWDSQMGIDFTIGPARRKVATVEEWFAGKFRATVEPAYSLEGNGLNWTCNYFDNEQQAIDWVYKRWEKFIESVMP